MNKAKETAIFKGRETTTTAFTPGLDVTTGDYVQIISGKYAGKCGRVIGVKFSNNREKKAMLTYTVMLSDKEAVQLPAGRLRLIRKGEDNGEI